jgi:hypothetical protein
LKDGKRARVWKYSAKVAELAAQYFLTVAMVKPVSETGTLLQDLMTEWAHLHSDLPSVSQTLPNMIRKLIQPAESAVHIYLFCQVLVNQVKYTYVFPSSLHFLRKIQYLSHEDLDFSCSNASYHELIEGVYKDPY